MENTQTAAHVSEQNIGSRALRPSLRDRHAPWAQEKVRTGQRRVGVGAEPVALSSDAADEAPAHALTARPRLLESQGCPTAFPKSLPAHYTRHSPPLHLLLSVSQESLQAFGPIQTTSDLHSQVKLKVKLKLKMLGVLDRPSHTDVSSVARTPRTSSGHAGFKDHHSSRLAAATARGPPEDTYRWVFMCFLQFREVLKVFWQ